MTMFDQMLGRLASLIDSQSGMRSGSGARALLYRQISTLKRDIRKTQEGRALIQSCAAEMRKANATIDASNAGECRYQSNPDFLTRNCRITYECLSNQGGGGD